MVDFADAAYFYVRLFLAIVTAVSALLTLRYGLEMHAHTGRRAMAFAGAGLLSVDVGLSSYDAVYNGFLTPGMPIRHHQLALAVRVRSPAPGLGVHVAADATGA